MSEIMDAMPDDWAPTLQVKDKIFKKVHLPGEWVWAEVLGFPGPNLMLARIDNHPVCDHDFEYGDIIEFEWTIDGDDGDLGSWEPAAKAPAASPA